MDHGGHYVFAKGQTIIQFLEQYAPKHLAVEGDRIGLQVGTLQKEMKKMMLTLDALENVVDEAIQKNVDLIISHHASIYRPLKNLRTDLPQGRIYQKLLKHDIAVYTAHTNLDITVGGINDVLARKMGIETTGVLEEISSGIEVQGKAYGIGRIGELEQGIRLEDFAQQVKTKLQLNGARVIGHLDQVIHKVAIVGGDGNSFVSTAAFKGVDVLITGDIYYHVAHEALSAGLAIIDVGHNVEKWVLPELETYFNQKFREKKIDTELIISEVDTNPFQFI